METDVFSVLYDSSHDDVGIEVITGVSINIGASGVWRRVVLYPGVNIVEETAASIHPKT